MHEIRLGWGLRNLPVKDWRWGWWRLQGTGDIYLPRATEKTLDSCLFGGSRVGWESQGFHRVSQSMWAGRDLNHHYLALLPYIWRIQGTEAQGSGELHFESFLRGTVESYIRIWGHKLYFPCSWGFFVYYFCICNDFIDSYLKYSILNLVFFPPRLKGMENFILVSLLKWWGKWWPSLIGKNSADSRRWRIWLFSYRMFIFSFALTDHRVEHFSVFTVVNEADTCT